MIYLVLSILISSFLLVIFKSFSKYKIDTFKAIVINYLVAFSLGILFTQGSFSFQEIPNQKWIYGAIFLGVLFVSVFFVMAKTAQNNGVSVASIAGKMSVVIPISFGVLLYNESLTFLKYVGIVIALIAVYLASVKTQKEHVKTAGILLPMLLFFGSGAIDTVLKYVQINYVSENDVAYFSASLFGVAGILGVFILLINVLKKKTPFGIKNIIAGIVLGIPNYFSIFFLIKALQNKEIESSIIFTINNVGVVVVSSLLGLLLFKEAFNLKNKIGILLAVLGIVIIGFS